MNLGEAREIIQNWHGMYPDVDQEAANVLLAHLDGAEVQRQIEYRDGRTWRRTLHIHATEWTPDKEKGVAT